MSIVYLRYQKSDSPKQWSNKKVAMPTMATLLGCNGSFTIATKCWQSQVGTIATAIEMSHLQCLRFIKISITNKDLKDGRWSSQPRRYPMTGFHEAMATTQKFAIEITMETTSFAMPLPSYSLVSLRCQPRIEILFGIYLNYYLIA